jgi:hypothetical protein
LNTAGDGFHENIGLNWGVGGRNFFFNNGGPGAPPAFGGHAPGADGALGFAGRAGGLNFNFNLTAGQGNDRSMSSQSATVVVPHGGSGALFHGQQRPFVTSVIPVVGAAPPAIPFNMAPAAVSPLAERLSRLRAEQALQRPAPRTNEAAPPPRAAQPSVSREDDPPLVLGKP